VVVFRRGRRRLPRSAYAATTVTLRCAAPRRLLLLSRLPLFPSPIKWREVEHVQSPPSCRASPLGVGGDSRPWQCTGSLVADTIPARSTQWTDRTPKGEQGTGRGVARRTADDCDQPSDGMPRVPVIVERKKKSDVHIRIPLVPIMGFLPIRVVRQSVQSLPHKRTVGGATWLQPKVSQRSTLFSLCLPLAWHTQETHPSRGWVS
jgi:hypothetical protein